MYKIMLVDDEPSVTVTLRRIIADREESFRVVAEAFNVEKALELVNECTPDIIFTDIKMPGESGIELIRKVTESYRDIVIIVISGYDDFSYVHDAFIYGVEDYLLKPIPPKKLLALLDSLAVKLKSRNFYRKLLIDQQKTDDSTRVALNEPSTSRPAEKLVAEIGEYVSANLTNDTSIQNVCQRFSISQPYLSRIFRQVKGCTFNDFVIGLKIETAKQLLLGRQDLLIGTIATLAGFSDQFYFSRVFKNATGLTPSEFRM